MLDSPPAPPASLCYSLAIIVLGETLARGSKHFDLIALACVALAIVLVALPLFLSPLRFSHRWIEGLIAIGVVIGFCRLPYLDLFLRYPQARSLLMPFIVLAAVAGGLAILILLRRPRSLVSVVFAILLLDVGLMGCFHINLAASPQVDVYVIQQLGCDSLLHGLNPFAMMFPDIYGPGAGYYPAKAVVNGQVQSGYFYPPLSLLWDIPGFLIGDLRYAQLLAVLLSAALIGYGERQFAPAVLLLFTPNLLFILENSWIETYAILLLAAVVWSTKRRQLWLVPIMAGLLLVTKQYLLLSIPALWLLLPIPWRWRDVGRFAIITLIAGSTVTLPFVLWSPRAFFHSMTTLYTNILRPDSISFLPIVSRIVGARLTLLCPLIAAVPPAALVLWRGQRSGAGYAAAVVLICLCVFAFSTQAFVNYYFFAIGGLCIAIAFDASSRPEIE